MEILTPKFEGRKTVYRCTCKQCGALVSIEPKEFVYGGDLTLTWNCPKCKRRMNSENILMLQRKKIVYSEFIVNE